MAANGKAATEKVPAVANPLSEEPTGIASNINYHAQFNPHFSPFKFEPDQAFFATAESVRDRLIKVFNDFFLVFCFFIHILCKVVFLANYETLCFDIF